jgi:hypothetical protein
MKMPRTLLREHELNRLKERYTSRGKEGKSRLLDEFCEQYSYDRKHAIKLLSDWFPKPTHQPKQGPEPKYEAVSEVLKHIWKASEQLCGKRLAPASKAGARLTLCPYPRAPGWERPAMSVENQTY